MMRIPEVLRAEGGPPLSGTRATKGKARKDKGYMYLTNLPCNVAKNLIYFSFFHLTANYMACFYMFCNRNCDVSKITVI